MNDTVCVGTANATVLMSDQADQHKVHVTFHHAPEPYHQALTMPSLTSSAALLVLSEHDAQPWQSLTWQGHTGILGVPWETPAGASPNDLAPNMDGWTVCTAQTVKTYAENLWSKSTLAHIQYSTHGYTDNDAEGCAAWNAFVQMGIHNWEFNKMVDNVLKDCKLTPYDVMAWAKSSQCVVFI